MSDVHGEFEEPTYAMPFDDKGEGNPSPIDELLAKYSYVPTNDPFEALLDAIIPLNFSDSMQFDVSEEQLERERQFIDEIIDKVNGSTACMPIQLDDLLSAGEVLLAPGPDVILVITDGCPECQRVLGEAPTTFSLEDVMKVIDEMMAAFSAEPPLPEQK